MANSNGKITSPIGLKEVYDVLGVAKSGTYYDVGYICGNAHGKINPYAKYKPVKWSSPSVDIKSGTNYRGEDGLCGFNIPVYSSLNELITGMNGGQNFTYNPPVPGKDWCRLTDFNGYNHNVQKGFFRSPSLSGQVIVLQGASVTIEISAMATASSSSDFISFIDLSPINPSSGSHIDASSMYVGVLFQHSNTDRFYAVSSSTFGSKQGNIKFSFTIDSTKMNKTYTYYVFLCQNRNLDVDSVFLPTDISPKKVTFISASQGVETYLSIRDIEDENGLFTIAYKNNGGGIRISTVTAVLYDENGESVANETVSSAFSLSNGASKTIDFDVFFDFSGYQNSSGASTYKLVVTSATSSGDGDIVREVNFERYKDGSWKQL